MLETILIGVAFVVGTTLLVWAGYFLMRAVAIKHAVDDTKELAGSVIFRVSALHGLILALVFAQQMVEYHSLRDETVLEASVIADIYFDMERHGGNEVELVQTALSRYVTIVIDEEWDSLGESGRLSGAAWQEWETVYQTLLDIGADTPRKENLRGQMLKDVRIIAQMRDKRASHSLKAISDMFWFAAVSGIFLISLAYYCFTPTFHNVILISIFAVFTGIVMFFIYSFSNPFGPPGALRPIAFEQMQLNKIGE